MKIVAGLVGGFVLACLAAILVGVTFAADGSGGMKGVVAFFVAWGAGFVIAMMAPKAAKAWRRILLSAAVLSFLMPLGGLFFTGSYVANNTASTAEAAGATIGGGLVSGVLGFAGFFAGIIFLVIGLLVGREKEVVYIERPAPNVPRG